MSATNTSMMSLFSSGNCDPATLDDVVAVPFNTCIRGIVGSVIVHSCTSRSSFNARYFDSVDCGGASSINISHGIGQACMVHTSAALSLKLDCSGKLA